MACMRKADNVLIRFTETKRRVIRNGVLGDFGFAKLVNEVESKSVVGSGFKGEAVHPISTLPLIHFIGRNGHICY